VATIVVKVMIAVMVPLGETAVAVAMVAVAMVAVTIEGLGISTTDIASRSRAIEVATGVRPGTTVDVARTVTGEGARAARAAA
jgi:hypothetical protein